MQRKKLIRVKVIWRNIEGYDGYYQISNTGFVRSKRLKDDWLYRKSYDSGGGYPRIDLVKNKLRKVHSIHNLVVETFIGKKNGLTVNHIDENKKNNDVSNLEICSLLENLEKSWTNGIHSKRRRLSKEDIMEIKKMLSSKIQQYKIGKKFGVHQSMISNIKNKKSYNIYNK